MMNRSGPWCAGFLSPDGGCAVVPQFAARTVGLIAATILLFIVGYIASRRREVRA
jgi:cyanate permease